MSIYFSTFQIGFYKVIKDLLEKNLKNLKIIYHSEDLIVYNTDSNDEMVKNKPFLNNSFRYIKQFNSSNMILLEAQIEWALQKDSFIKEIQNYFKDDKHKIRFVFSKFGKTQAIDVVLKNELEDLIIQNTNLSIHKTLPDYEIWFMQRREGFGICGVRITKKPDYQHVLEKGELREELSYLLNYLSEPNENDIYLDPFCGNGALPISRAIHFPYKKILSSDKDISRINKNLKKRELKFDSFEFKQADFFSHKFGSMKFNKIVTDPPWGEEQMVGDLGEFYSKLLEKAKEIIVKNGIMILLVANKEFFIKTLEKFENEFKLDCEFKTHIGGREVFVLRLILI